MLCLKMTLSFLILIYNQMGGDDIEEICNNPNNTSGVCSAENCPLCDIASPVDEFKYEASEEIAATMANYFGGDEKFSSNEYVVTKEVYEDNSTIIDYLQTELKPLITNSESLGKIEDEIMRLKREVK